MLKATKKRSAAPVAHTTSSDITTQSLETVVAAPVAAGVAMVDLAQSEVLKCLVNHQCHQRSQGWVSLADLMIQCRLSQLEATVQLKALFACQMLEFIMGNGAVANRYRLDPAAQERLPTQAVQVVIPQPAKVHLPILEPEEKPSELPVRINSSKEVLRGDTGEGHVNHPTLKGGAWSRKEPSQVDQGKR